MSFNQFENIFLEEAIRKLEVQLTEKGEWGPGNGRLYLGGPYTFMLVDNHLTIADKSIIPDAPRKDITPVDCYNFYRPMCLAVAVAEYIDRQRNPGNYEGMPSFFV